MLGKNLKFLRKRKGMNQDALAEALGITRNKIASYETQRVEPKLSLLLKMSSFFGITIKDLISREINNKNYQNLLLDHKEVEKIMQPEGSDTENSAEIVVIEKGRLEELMEKNLQIGKMIEGLQAYYALNTEDSDNFYDNQQLMQVLRHLLEINESLMEELNQVQH